MKYRIAYDCTNHKVGCVLIQAVVGTLPSFLFHKYFGNVNCWTVDAGACAIYEITEEQLPMLVAQTDFTR